ncbi:hypothetical protein DFH09DRAFT_1092858 [Mycena vulgaris]|nr:hypothetical protein DFH09DRAFT_1092858 [Mycena vulgaris]
MSKSSLDIEGGRIWPGFGHNWSRVHTPKEKPRPPNSSAHMGKDQWKAKGRKSRSLAQKAGLFAVNFGRIFSDSKPRSNDDLDKQLAWHRRHELSTLKKRSEAQIPGVSKLSNEALKVQALIAAVVLYNSRTAVAADLGATADNGTLMEVDGS